MDGMDGWMEWLYQNASLRGTTSPSSLSLSSAAAKERCRSLLFRADVAAMTFLIPPLGVFAALALSSSMVEGTSPPPPPPPPPPLWTLLPLPLALTRDASVFNTLFLND